MSNVNILLKFIAHYEPDFRTAEYDNDDFYVFCAKHIIECKACKINYQCSYFTRTKYPTISNKELQKFKTEHPEYFI